MAKVYTDELGYINFRIPCISDDGLPLSITSATANAGTPTWFDLGTSDADGTLWPEGQEYDDGRYVLHVVFKLVAADVPYGTHTIDLTVSNGTSDDSVSFDINHTQITPVADNNLPTDIPDMESWFPMDTLIGHYDGSVVREVHDPRDYTIVLKRNATSSKPRFFSNQAEINNKAVITFDNTDDTTYFISSNGTRTYFIVAKPTSKTGTNLKNLIATAPITGANFRATVSTDNGGDSWYMEIVHSGYPFGAKFTVAIPDVDSYHIYTIHQSKNEHLSVWVDGILLGVFYSDFGGGKTFNDFQIGRFLHGDVAEVITYSRDLTESEHQYVLKYLGSKYGITYGSSPVISDPTIIDGCYGWYHAGAIVEDSGVIDQLTDLSGNDNHLLPVASNNRPAIITNAIGATYPVIRFDGADDFLQTTYASELAVDNSFFIVCKFDSVSGTQTLFDGINSTNRKSIQRDQINNDYDFVYGSTTKSRGYTHGTEYKLITNLSGTGNLWSWIDQDFMEDTLISNSTGLTGLTLGAQHDGTSFLDGDIAEIIIFDRYLSEAERYEVERYLEDKYFSPGTEGAVAPATPAPLGVSNLLTWWDPSNIILSDTTNSSGSLLINRVRDSSTNDYKLTPFNNDDALRPIKGVGITGQPEIDFTQNGSAQLTSNFGSSQGDEFTVFVVGRVFSDEIVSFDAGYLFDGDTVSKRIAFWYGREGRGTVGIDHGGTEVVHVGCLLDGEHKTGSDSGSYSDHLLRFHFKPTGSDDEFYMNGQLLASGDAGGETVDGMVVAGPVQGLDADNDNMLSLYMCDMLVYTGTLSSGDITTVEDFLIAKHSLNPYTPAPLSVPDLEVWYDAEYLADSDVDGSDFITEWKARSSTGYAMTSVGGASTNQPTLLTGGSSSNFQNYAAFTATSAENMQIIFPADIGNTVTIFMVANVNSDAAPAVPGTFFDGVTTGNRMRLSYGLTSEAEITLDHGGTPSVLGSTNMADGVKLIRCEFNGTGVNDEVYIDQVQVIDADTGDDTLTGITLGNVFDPTSGTNDQTPWTTTLDGNIWACLVYSRALTTQEKSDIESYLKERYAI